MDLGFQLCQGFPVFSGDPGCLLPGYHMGMFLIYDAIGGIEGISFSTEYIICERTGNVNLESDYKYATIFGKFFFQCIQKTLMNSFG